MVTHEIFACRLDFIRRINFRLQFRRVYRNCAGNKSPNGCLIIG